ncbi:extracellular tyrosine-protein kinase PKDCC-like [Gigantopelta aegis]|uniref:extracellular tyrosine-protein kinase PKDCC-like n=1 Tax=Gigantopelta aegis TaxID=1735272 RepID=UPI001B88CC7B|nr:extracellular tyrosine-protein kinase PKDCC-like [Gigantopelta aegis]
MPYFSLENIGTSPHVVVRNNLSEMTIAKAKFLFDCTNIHNIKIKKKVGHGVSKQTFLGEYKGMHVAVKMVTRHLNDVRTCLDNLKRQAKDSPKDKGLCYLMPTMKLMKEILFLEQLDHPQLVKLLGYCVRSEESDSTDISEHGVVAVYEFGHRFVIDSLQILPWQKKLEHAIDMAQLLDYLEYSPLGSLVVPDFKEGHFLLVNSSLKIIDMDDVNNLEPSCGSYDISRNALHQDGCEFGLSCRQAMCIGFNAKINLKNMNKLIFKRLLYPVTFPNNLVDEMGQINAKLDSLSISARELRTSLKAVHSRYV